MDSQARYLDMDRGGTFPGCRSRAGIADRFFDVVVSQAARYQGGSC
jgi:hypothetical protein